MAAPNVNVDDQNSASGLERLAKDILEAQAKDATTRADALLRSMVLPNPTEWYEKVFRDPRVGGYYAKASAGVPPYLAKLFLNARSQGFTQPQVRRFEHSCDDNATEDTYEMLLKRQDPIPLYELRFINGDKFTRIFPVVYVEGRFRFLLPLDYQPPKQQEDESGSRSGGADQKPPEPRVRVGDTVQAAKLVNRVQPAYPQTAKDERLEGKVVLHVIIGKDGSIREIERVRGRCSLAKSAVEAVRQWRYSPTLLNGNPVEVDTEIQVTFQLR
jgi:TonB family protein